MSALVAQRSTTRVWLPTLRLEHAWIVLAIVATFFGPASSPVLMLDLGWTLRSGAWMVEHGQLLTTDPFTSAPAVANQVDLQWLAQLVFYALYHVGDLPLVIAASAVAVSLAYGLVLGAATVACGRPKLACLALVPAYAVGFTNLTPRPQTLAYPLFGLSLMLLVRARRSGGRGALWLLPPLTAVSANVHGSFFLGPLLVGCFAAGAALEARSPRAAAPYALVLVGCVLGACLTPYGVGSWGYVTSLTSNPVVRDFASEWTPTSLVTTEGKLFFASVAAVLGLCCLRRPRPGDVVLLIVFGALGLTAVRSVVWWGMVIAPIAASLLAAVVPTSTTSTRERPLLNLAIIGLLLSLALTSLPWLKQGNPLLPESKQALVEQEMPPDLVTFLQSHTSPGALLTHEGWGGYIEWALWPEQRPFVDGRFELHPAEVWQDYLAMTFARADWQALADRYDIGCMVLWKRAEPHLIEAARTSHAWRIDYEDDQAVVFVRA